jgi:hypothetical protein
MIKNSTLSAKVINHAKCNGWSVRELKWDINLTGAPRWFCKKGSRKVFAVFPCEDYQICEKAERNLLDSGAEISYFTTLVDAELVLT